MYKLLSFLARGKNRKLVLQQLDDARTPTELSKKINMQRSVVSRAILELEKKGLAECLTPKEKMGRFYRITNVGKKLLQMLNSRKKA